MLPYSDLIDDDDVDGVVKTDRALVCGTAEVVIIDAADVTGTGRLIDDVVQRGAPTDVGGDNFAAPELLLMRRCVGPWDAWQPWEADDVKCRMANVGHCMLVCERYIAETTRSAELCEQERVHRCKLGCGAARRTMAERMVSLSSLHSK